MTLETYFRIARWKSEGRPIGYEKLSAWGNAWARWIYRRTP
jgi:hypothetical protein